MSEKISNQQTKTNQTIEEILPETLECPRCKSTAKRVTTKRGIHYKCTNESCLWDSNRIFDFEKEGRQQHIRQVINILKTLIPKLNYAENFSYNPDMIFTGEKLQQSLKYDISCFFMGQKINRIRVERNQHLTKKQFFDSKYCYVVGRPEVVDYMAKRKGLVAHFLIDEKKERIGISRMDKIIQTCKKEKDNFGNLQYFIPKDIRPALVTFDPGEIEDMIFKGWHRTLYRDLFLR